MGLGIGEMAPELMDACQQVAAAARRHGKAAGIDLASLEQLPTFAAYGFTLFTFGSDTGYLMDGATSANQAARERLREKAQ
jgi:4-hydroxy-2-oxoheptanedioate aldolase